MIKLSDLIRAEIQPSEKSRMKNYLYRGSRDQINLHPNRFNIVGSKPGAIEQENIGVPKSPLPSNGRPENRYRTVPFEWDESDGIFERNQGIGKELIGREFQTIQDLKSIVTRLTNEGHTKDEIITFILNYIQ